jgi:hypothetical protein
MAAVKAQKLSAADSSNPLQRADTLQHVLAYVGPGHWCFVAEVSSLWRDVYGSLLAVELIVRGFFDDVKAVHVVLR